VNLPAVLPAAATRRVRDRLAQAPDGPVRLVHDGPNAVYLDVGGWCVGVVDAEAAQVPCALRVLALTGLTGGSARITAGTLHLDGVPLRIGRIVDASVPRLRPDLLPDHPRRPDAARGPAAPATRVAELVGAGDGLTPYGDDMLCGWLALHRAAGLETPAVDAAVRALLHRTTLLSATLLDCAMHGEVLPEFAHWVRALGTPEEPTAAALLETVGHSSGRGLLAGARRALAALRTVVAA
jgi:hypothetical protein